MSVTNGTHKQLLFSDIIVFAEADSLAPEFHLDEVMTVDPLAGLKGEKGADAQHDGTEHFVPDIEVVSSRI